MRRGLAVGLSAFAWLVVAPAAGAQEHRDITLDADKALVEVKVPSEGLYRALAADYDFVEALQRNGDGSISTDVLANAAKRSALRAAGVRIVTTLEDAADTAEASEERETAFADERTAR